MVHLIQEEIIDSPIRKTAYGKVVTLKIIVSENGFESSETSLLLLAINNLINEQFELIMFEEDFSFDLV